MSLLNSTSITPTSYEYRALIARGPQFTSKSASETFAILPTIHEALSSNFLTQGFDFSTANLRVVKAATQITFIFTTDDTNEIQIQIRKPTEMLKRDLFKIQKGLNQLQGKIVNVWESLSPEEKERKTSLFNNFKSPFRSCKDQANNLHEALNNEHVEINSAILADFGYLHTSYSNLTRIFNLSFSKIKNAVPKRLPSEGNTIIPSDWKAKLDPKSTPSKEVLEKFLKNLGKSWQNKLFRLLGLEDAWKAFLSGNNIDLMNACQNLSKDRKIEVSKFCQQKAYFHRIRIQLNSCKLELLTNVIFTSLSTENGKKELRNIVSAIDKELTPVTQTHEIRCDQTINPDRNTYPLKNVLETASLNTRAVGSSETAPVKDFLAWEANKERPNYSKWKNIVQSRDSYPATKLISLMKDVLTESFTDFRPFYPCLFKEFPEIFNIKNAASEEDIITLIDESFRIYSEEVKQLISSYGGYQGFITNKNGRIWSIFYGKVISLLFQTVEGRACLERIVDQCIIPLDWRYVLADENSSVNPKLRNMFYDYKHEMNQFFTELGWDEIWETMRKFPCENGMTRKQNFDQAVQKRPEKDKRLLKHVIDACGPLCLEFSYEQIPHKILKKCQKKVFINLIKDLTSNQPDYIKTVVNNIHRRRCAQTINPDRNTYPLKNVLESAVIPAGILASDDVETEDESFASPRGSTEVVSIEDGPTESKFTNESTKRELLSNSDSAASAPAGIAVESATLDTRAVRSSPAGAAIHTTSSQTTESDSSTDPLPVLSTFSNSQVEEVTNSENFYLTAIFAAFLEIFAFIFSIFSSCFSESDELIQ